MSYITQDQFNSIAFSQIPVQTRKRGNQSTKQKYYYKDVVAAFDIETTYIKEIDNSVMYIWQMQIGKDTTIIGRTWYEFRRLIEKIEDALEPEERLVIFVHNLSFEFVFLSGIYDFNKDDVFAVDSRKVLKAELHHKIEFRCSYLQTNMSLRSFCEKMGVKSFKLKMNYKKKRYWYTELSQKEIAYCINDVRGLVEAIYKEMERDNDTLYSLPLTSTGYARRDAKAAMRLVSHNFIQNLAPDYNIYLLLREAFRGGNTHASRFYSNKILDYHTIFNDDPEYYKKVFGTDPAENGNIIGYSEDISSSYPTEIYTGEYPMSKFQIRKNATIEDVEELIYEKHKAVLIRCSLMDIELRDDTIPVPYLPVSKCHGIIGGVYDNGRILKADYIDRFTMTDIDYKILKSQYKFKMSVTTLASARYGKLPRSFREMVLEYYINKTSLKDKPGDDEHSEEFYTLMYNKFKALLNALYGMTAQDPVKISTIYINTREDIFKADPDADPEKLLEQYNKKAFLVYQWGVWVTAHAREKLQRGIDLCGLNFVYCDTDSCKYIGKVDWTELNKDLKKVADKTCANAIDPNGKKHYMGIYEDDGAFIEFKTMGAKKYAYRTPEYTDKEGKVHKPKLKITIAGVNKRIGAIELERAGGLKAMTDGFKFKYAGGLEARYSDFPTINEYITEDNVPIKITRNVSLVENTKTLGLTAEYKELLSSYKSYNIEL